MTTKQVIKRMEQKGYTLLSNQNGYCIFKNNEHSVHSKIATKKLNFFFARIDTKNINICNKEIKIKDNSWIILNVINNEIEIFYPEKKDYKIAMDICIDIIDNLKKTKTDLKYLQSA